MMQDIALRKTRRWLDARRWHYCQSYVAVTCFLFLLTRQGPTADNLSAETKQILEEITRYLNLEKLLPCYRHTVTVRCVILMMSLFLRNWWRKWLNLCNICMEECIVSSYLDVSHSLFSFNNCSKVI